MILEDFLMLGKTIPEPTSDGRVFVCSAGYSEDLRSLVRLYPLARRDCPPRWSRSRVAVERNPKDSRRESFALKGNRNPSDHADINRLFEMTTELSPKARDHLVERIVDRSIADLNVGRRSLGVLQPEGVAELHFDENPASPDSPQLSLGAGGKSMISAPLVVELLAQSHIVALAIESVNSMPGEGPTGAHTFGRGREFLRAAGAALGIPRLSILRRPGVERSDFRPEANTKDAARAECIRRWPQHASWFALKESNGVADAPLICLAGVLLRK